VNSNVDKMAPLSAEPRQILVVLNLARRKAFYSLIGEITAYMRSQLELNNADLAPKSPKLPNSTRDHNAAPLFVVDPADDQGRDQGYGQERQLQPGAARPSRELIALRRDALSQFDGWKNEVLSKLRELLSAADDAKILEARQKRKEKIEATKRQVPGQGENLISFGEADSSKRPRAPSNEVEALQKLFHPIPTRFTTIPVEDRKEVVGSLLVFLLSLGNYSAHSRALSIYLTSAFELPLSFLINEETEIAKSLMETSTAAENQAGGTMSADAETAKRKQENQTSRFWKVGLASVAGAAVIGITGGLAAPVVAGAIGGLMGSVGLGGVASFLGLFWMNGALVGTLFGAYGAKMTVRLSS
jgi:hypothetical protein